jgi:hypothetical protein
MTSDFSKFAATHVLMVEPVRFRYNEETGESNTFQSVPASGEAQAIAEAAVREHRALRDLLVSNGVHVTVVRCNERTPDAPFCNNWFSTHPAVAVTDAEGTRHTPASLVLYPLLAPNRRLERRADLIAMLRTKYPRVVDLSGYEREARFLESTGSLCLDDANRVAYAALSPRTDRALVEHFGRELGYSVQAFTATDATGVPYYHTNVMMFIGHGLAGITLEAIEAADERRRIERSLLAGGLELLAITRAQAAQFCGNVLSLTNDRGDALFVMSGAAWDAFTPAQRAQLEAHGAVLSSPLTAFERVGGGSARCLIAELF